MGRQGNRFKSHPKTNPLSDLPTWNAFTVAWLWKNTAALCTALTFHTCTIHACI